jgi:hypothetical protein
MAKCDYCGSTIVIGGVRVGQQRFCNNKCRNNAYILSVSQNVPPDVLEKQIEEVWRGNCPKCRGLGPIDVHKSYQVWSALVLTRYSTHQQLSCRSCATKRQAGALFFSLFFGWWGFPSGLILTPVQVTRNVMNMVKGPDPAAPSADLRKMMQVHLGSKILARQQQSASAAPPLVT